MPSVETEVLESWNETPSIHAVTLAKPAGFSFKPGQFCIFKIGGDDRTFSLSCSPEKTNLEFATRLSESDFKKKFFALKKGDKISLMGPMGSFFLDDKQDNVVMLSGGIGITPLKSMLEHVFDAGLSSKVTLLYSNRSPDEIPFKKDLDALRSANVKIVYTVSNNLEKPWDGKIGSIDEQMIRENVPSVSSSLFFICGPPAMVDALKTVLKSMGVEDLRIKAELFSGYK